MKTSCFFVVLFMIASCSQDEPGRNESFADIIKVSSVNLEQVTYNGKSTAVQLSFTRAFEETAILEYRLYIVKGDDHALFSIERAESRGSEGYLTLKPTGNDVQLILPENILDFDGDLLVPDVEYSAFVLSIVDESSIPVGYPYYGNKGISEKSNVLIIKS